MGPYLLLGINEKTHVRSTTSSVPFTDILLSLLEFEGVTLAVSEIWEVVNSELNVRFLIPGRLVKALD